ncbi:MAG: hypothetical protein LBD86_02400 [Spirochaetaceae bacterium]|jgi:hypothetical protein|nr:hypothetical protein [Spirochaetaceae bacterium]
MNRTARTAVFLLPLFLCAAAVAGGLGGAEKKTGNEQMPESKTLEIDITGRAGGGETAPQNRLVRVSGRVRLVGSAVFPELVLSGENREWFIGKDEQSLLVEFQQRLVTVEGTESYADLSFANGLPAGRRYTLKNIKLIDIDSPQ